MHALLIQVEFSTGRRAGGVNPKDNNLPCDPLWQNTETGREVRLIKDGSWEQYEGVDGITVLKNEDQIDAAIEGLDRPEEFVIANEALMIEWLRRKPHIDLDDFAGLDARGLNKALHDCGCPFITNLDRKPPTAREMAHAHRPHEKGPKR